MLSVDELETSARKGKFAVTPPTSPLAFNSFGSQQNGGVYGSSTPTSPTRQMSDSGDDGIDGKYSHKSEFNFSFITNGGSNTLKSNTSGSPKNGYDNGGFDKRGSNFSEDKYKWNDEPTVRADTAPGNSKTATRKICVCVLVTLLILGIIAGAVAVILKYKVFDTGEDDVPDVTTTIRPEELSIEGSLDLNQTWTRELDDPASQLYINTTDTFTAEIDRIMENSSFADVYIRTVVLDLSPGSIKVKFRMHNNGRYKLQSNSPAAYTTAVEDHIKDASRGAILPIVRSSVILQVGASSTSTVTPTSTSTISSTSSTTSTSPNTTTLSTTSTPNTTTSSSTTTSTTNTTTSTTTSTTSTTVTTPNTTTSSTSTTSTTVTTPNTTTSSTTSSTTTSTSTTTTPTTTTEVDHPPTARAGADVTMTLPTNTVTLDGSGSSDDKGITSYQWQKISGPQTMDISGVNTDSPHVSNLVEGVYTLRLTVRDVRGHTSSDTVTITVNPEPTTTSTTTTTPMPDLCTPVTFEPCMSRGFTQTVLPNLFNHINQSQAAEAYNEVAKDVFNQICQESALTYLCTLYFPKCSPDTGEPEYACLSLCEESITTCGNYFTNPFPCEYFVDANCTGLMTTTPGPVTTTQTPTCEDTYVEECMALGFTETQFPNLLYEPTQESANETFYMYFLPEIEAGCHENLLYFICSLQFPKCIDGLVYKPCQRVCQETSEACPDVNYFNCSDFPEIDCMAPIQPKAAMLSRKRLHCNANQFSCNKVTKCISNDLVCNGVDDCGDWTDEMDCVCGEYQYQCAMGMCIKSYQRCDGTNHCPDRSDELNCQGCTHGQVACPSGKCIMSEWICDGRSECEDGWDENNCDVCGDRYFTCADRNRTCIPLSNRCDGVRHCPDGYDEFECIMDELGELHLPVHKTDLPICASSWSEMYGDYTCELLGRGPYINKTDVFSNLPVFLKLSSSGSATQLKSVLGPVEVQYDCPGNKAVKINCEPRGCGKRMMKIYSDYVVNGEDAKPGAWPWHAALYYGGQYFCGGSLISNEFILTAAHCVEKRSANYGLMTVKLGVNHRSRDEETQHVVKVEAVHSHMDHVYFVRNDIALIQLEKPVNFTKYIQPICLPTKTEELPLYSSCFTVGWGKTKWSGDYSEVLQQLKMTLWDTNKCNSSIAWNGSIYDTFLCAGYYSGVRSICTGDSGGPLLCEDATRTWKLHGVSSYVANYCNMTERPNIFTDVRDLMPWIQDKIECKFRCDNGKCLYNRDYLCDRVDHCGDNSDETRICNKTVTCDFEDKFLCGYQFSGWEIGQDNRNSTRKDIGGVFYTESNAPQFDNTIGKFPGHFCFGKHSGVLDADLTTPRFITSGQTCIRFAYYLRGDVKIGLRVMMREFYGGTNNYTLSTKWPLRSAPPKYSPDEWKTGYFDLTMGQFVMIFTTGDLLMAAIDDVEMIPGMCSNVLCKSDEFWCRGRYEDKCIPRESNCNLVVDCEGEEDENQCTQGTGSYVCTFENGNACGLRQEIGDSTDWWLVNASFVQDEIGDTKFQDHTDQSDGGNVFYLHRYAIQFDTHIYMWQLFYLNSQQYCFSFYYQLRKDGVTFNIYLDCPGCVRETHIAQSTFDNKWALFQVTLPVVDVINVTYDVFGDSVNQFYSFITIDDIFVKPGICPEYVCPANYTKCRKTDRCIPVKSLCDRNVDCMDEFDEENCNCNAAEYRCDNGRCIPGNLTCDRTTQCLDGSDEGNICVPLRNVTCTFEHPYVCGYEYLRYTNYKWRNHQGYTPTPVTGPDVDHTYKNSSGHFMYAEANEGSKGDNSSIISPEFITSPGQSLLFFYHMFSYSTSDHSPGALEFRLVNQENGQIVFQWYADITKLADIWQELCYDLPSGLRLKAWFTAIRNETTTYGVDIAIDDVQLNPYTCTEMETTKSSYRPTASRRTTMAPTATIAPSGSTCAADQWQCRSYQCIPADYRCDGEGDCTDDSDEDNCP